MTDIDHGATSVMLEQRLEAIPLPVSDIDRAKQFYANLGWRLDIDFAAPGGSFRIVQFTPPGSPCSIQFGTNATAAKPGCVQGLLLVVQDIEAAHDELAHRGVDIGDVYHVALGKGPEPGPAPMHLSYASFADFNDPDGNGWKLQEIRERLPGR